MTHLIYLTLLFSASIWDLRSLRIPDLLSLGGFSLLILLRWVDSGFPGDFICSAVTCFVLMTALVILTRGKLGMGDAKLTLSIGGTLGLYAWFFSLAMASLTALITVLILLGTKNLRPDQPIPFAPFLSLGGLILFFIPLEEFLAL